MVDADCFVFNFCCKSYVAWKNNLSVSTGIPLLVSSSSSSSGDDSEMVDVPPMEGEEEEEEGPSTSTAIWKGPALEGELTGKEMDIQFKDNQWTLILR